MIPTEMSSDLRQPFKTRYFKIYGITNIAEADWYRHILYTSIKRQAEYVKVNHLNSSVIHYTI